MRALVVYESMFGNTEHVARAIGDGLAASMEVEVVDVGHAPTPPPQPVDLVVVGGPTHGFSMSRERTRDDAVSQGGTDTGPEVGIRDWLDRLPPGPHTELVATFDTRVDKVRHLPGSAAKAAAKAARKHGYRTATKPESFWVGGTEGPLLDGELERARSWGERLAVAAAQGGAHADGDPAT